MKQFSPTSLVLALALCASVAGRASTCTATTSGNWQTAATWSCGHAPVAGDLVIVPLGITVSVYSNIIYTGAAMNVKVYGALFFVGPGSKLSFPCNSHVQLMTENSTVNGDSSGNSQTIKICGVVYWSVADGRMTGYLIWPETSLPVELLYFQGSADMGIVGLQWATASESASARFELFRSMGAGGEVPVAVLTAAGFSQQLTTYQYQERMPSIGTWVYRLEQFDTDGTSTDLGSVIVQVKAGADVQCYPIPASEQVTVVTGSIPSTLFLRDPEGRTVLHMPLTNQTTVIPVDQLPSGTYVAQVIAGDRMSLQRVQLAH